MLNRSKFLVVSIGISLLLLSCESDDAPKTINSRGIVKLDNIGKLGDGWGILGLAVSNSGTEIYYSVVNFSLNRYEVRMIDEKGKIQKLFSGDGQIDALNISNDDSKLVYSYSGGEDFGSKLYQFNLVTKISGLLLRVIGDGSFLHLHYLPNGDIIYNQGDGMVALSLRSINPTSRQVKVLIDKDENPILHGVDYTQDRLLVSGWSSYKFMTMNFDGSDLKEYGEQKLNSRVVCFSPGGEEILAYEAGQQGSPSEPLFNIITFDTETGEKTYVNTQTETTFPVAYGADENEILCQVGTEFPSELKMFDRSSGTFEQLTNNQQDEWFLGFYGNSSRRIVYAATDESGQYNLYILNR